MANQILLFALSEVGRKSCKKILEITVSTVRAFKWSGYFIVNYKVTLLHAFIEASKMILFLF